MGQRRLQRSLVGGRAQQGMLAGAAACSTTRAWAAVTAAAAGAAVALCNQRQRPWRQPLSLGSALPSSPCSGGMLKWMLGGAVVRRQRVVGLTRRRRCGYRGGAPPALIKYGSRLAANVGASELRQAARDIFWPLAVISAHLAIPRASCGCDALPRRRISARLIGRTRGCSFDERVRAA